MLINEHRLIVIEPEAKRFLAEQMERFFFGSPEEAPAAPDQKKEAHHGEQE
jgi:Fe-S cluster biosynthesis and repair protein YggX